MVDNNPLDMEDIKEQKDADDTLLEQATKYVDRFTPKRIDIVNNILFMLSQETSKSMGNCFTKSSIATNN
jgi:hypothetical protein